ncbi:MAG: ACP phosphodiesterase [Bacteroidia bacterium]
MNYLAHFYLSDNQPHLLVGNFIADQIKGKQIDLLPTPIAHGVRLHRFIDDFTDKHPVVSQSKARLRYRYRKYAGVIVDIFYDHFLAAYWEQYSEIDLKCFSKNVYSILESHTSFMPKICSELILPTMKKQDWLCAYATLNGIERSLNGLSKRTRFDSQMEHAIEDFKKDYFIYLEEFQEFLPDLIKAVNNF